MARTTKKDPVGINRGKATKPDPNAPDPYGILGITTSSGDASWASVPVIGGNEMLGRPGTTAVPTTSTYKGPRGLNLSGTVQAASNPTAGSLLHDFAQMRGSALANLQYQMWRAGFYGSDKPNIGTFDASKDIAAFRVMLLGHIASGQQTTIGAYLNDAVTHWQKTGAGRTPLVVKLMNPDDLRVTLQDTAQKLYGQFLPDEQVNKFVASFQAMQTAEQNQAYIAGGFNPETGQQDTGGFSTLGGTITAPPSPGAEAETYIRSNFPNQVAATQFGNAMGNIIDTLRNPAA